MTSDPKNLMARPCQRKAKGDWMLPRWLILSLIAGGLGYLLWFWLGLVPWLIHLVR